MLSSNIAVGARLEETASSEHDAYASGEVADANRVIASSGTEEVVQLLKR